jgi:hypothetical protein
MAQAPPDVEGTNIMSSGPVSTKFNSGSDISRGQVRDVTSTNVSADKTQSIDQLGGANSEFFKNMMGQLQPQFAQQRSEGLAAAKESAGSLTGSGFANRLGSSVNRSLGNEQATAANFASQAIGLEQTRQGADANRNLQAAGMNQSAALTASQANQGADSNFINSILQRNSQGLQAQGMQLQAETQNQNTSQQQNLTQAQLDQQRKLQQYQTQAGLAQSNAGNYANLIGGQASLGVGPSTVQQKPGIGQGLLAGIGAGVGGFFGGPGGAQLGGSIGAGIGSSF